VFGSGKQSKNEKGEEETERMKRLNEEQAINSKRLHEAELGAVERRAERCFN
jgi:hypothetical protein